MVMNLDGYCQDAFAQGPHHFRSFLAVNEWIGFTTT